MVIYLAKMMIYPGTNVIYPGKMVIYPANMVICCGKMVIYLAKLDQYKRVFLKLSAPKWGYHPLNNGFHSTNRKC